jgi:hypothetical protein
VYKYVAPGITGPPIQFHALWPGREAFNLWASSTSCCAFPETIYSKEFNPRSLGLLTIDAFKAFLLHCFTFHPCPKYMNISETAYTIMGWGKGVLGY